MGRFDKKVKKFRIKIGRKKGGREIGIKAKI